MISSFTKFCCYDEESPDVRIFVFLKSREIFYNLLAKESKLIVVYPA